MLFGNGRGRAGGEEMPTRLTRRVQGVLIAVVVLAASCSRPGSEFLGTWVNTMNPKETIEITRNGDQYLAVVGGQKMGAIYKDGTLEVASPLMGTVRMTYVRESTTLLAASAMGASIEFKRQQ
jgi:hypothetical protein